MTGNRARLICAAALGVLATALIAGPASAHVDVEADNPQAGARDVTLSFVGEAESSTSGIKSERVVLPEGMAPGDVALVEAPKGWKFTTGADGFTVSGPALKVGQDSAFAVRVAQLPTGATTLSFKTLETYADGKVSRWIDIPQEGEPEPDTPAPTLKLKPAAAVATSSPEAGPTSVSAAPSTQGGSDAPSTAPLAETPAADTGGSATVWWILVAVVVVVALAGGLLFWQRRSRSPRG